MFCTYCGSRAVEDAAYCWKCGAPLPRQHEVDNGCKLNDADQLDIDSNREERSSHQRGLRCGNADAVVMKGRTFLGLRKAYCQACNETYLKPLTVLYYVAYILMVIFFGIALAERAVEAFADGDLQHTEVARNWPFLLFTFGPLYALMRSLTLRDHVPKSAATLWDSSDGLVVPHKKSRKSRVVMATASVAVVLVAMVITGIFNLSNVRVHATTCRQFNDLGDSVDEDQELFAVPPTRTQAELFKQVIADYAGRLSILPLSSRNTALQFATKNDRLSRLLGESLAMTRAFCIERPDDPMQEVAIEQFNHLLDAIATGLSR